MSELVLVTGAAGYAGSTLVDKLLQKGYRVRAFDNGQRNNCDSLLCFVNNPNFEFQYGHVNDYKALTKAFEGVNYCSHLAACVGMPITQKYVDYSWLVNYEGTEVVLNARPKNVKLMFASTGSVYGALSEVCTEECKTSPLSEYGRQKLAAETLVIQSGNSTAFRYATAFGISRNTRLDLLLNQLTIEAVKNKVINIFQADFKRTFIHVNDFTDAIIYAFENWNKFNGQVFNVGTEDNNWSKREIAEYLKKRTGCLVFYPDEGFQDPDLRNYVVNYDKVEATGFRCKVYIEDGIAELMKAAPILDIGNSRYQDKLL